MPPPAGLPPGARRTVQQGNEFYVIGDERRPLRDAYHTFLKAGWSVSLLMIGLAFVLANVIFAVIYLIVGGVSHSEGSFLESLSFSVQTMATIGYGVMAPESAAATTVMIVESVAGIIFTALATGLVFAKFSRPTARVAFSRYAVITQHEGQRTLMFRVGNRRGNVIVEAQLHLVAVTTTTTAEGGTFYKASDLKLVRDRQVGMTRGWTVMHLLDDTSPLRDLDTTEKLAASELELYCAVTGIDDITVQTIHAIHTYHDPDIRIGYRLADTLIPISGTFLVDLREFDSVIPDRP